MPREEIVCWLEYWSLQKMVNVSQIKSLEDVATARKFCACMRVGVFEKVTDAEIWAAMQPVTNEDGIDKFELADMDAWEDFVENNREPLIEQYGTIEAALKVCLDGGMRLGGGAAPIVDVYFAM